MKYLNIALLVLVLSGCSHREYYKTYKGGSGNLEVDKARCRLEAEKNVPLNNPQTVVNIKNFSSSLSKKERKEAEEQERQRQNSAQYAKDNKISKLTDLCLKSKGWSWNYVKD